MGYSAAVKARNNTNKNAPATPGKPANVAKAEPMGKVVQVKGKAKVGTGPKSIIGKKSGKASVKSSGMSNKLMVTDLPKKSQNGRKAGWTGAVPRSAPADVTRATKA